MQSLIGGDQIQAAAAARRASAEAFLAREASRAIWSGMSAGAARRLARDSFPSLVGRRAGALPPLGAGQRVVGYPSDNAAQVALPGGKHGVIQSLEPIAIETAPGRHEPLDLALGRFGEGFKPIRAGVGVYIPKRLADGVELPGSHVSLTPVDARGAALSGSEGSLDGATVVYANTQTDADTLVKPVTDGFETDTLLRSQDSPTQLRFRVGVPAGAHLKRGRGGAVEVVERGVAVAAVPTPSAQDAAGVAVPVSMSLTGETLVLGVDARPGQYQYPIAVDPTVNETGTPEHKIRFAGTWGIGTWGFFTENASVFKGYEAEYEFGKYAVKDEVSKSIVAGERAFFYYPTQGESRIYFVTATTKFEGGFAGGKMEDVLGIENVHSATIEASKSWIENYVANETVCALAGCATGTVNSSNNKSEVFFQQDARETNPFTGGTAWMTEATVGIVQEAPPSTSFVAIPNWVRPNSFTTFLHLNSSDPGLGISSGEVKSPTSPGWPGGGVNANCTGVQCDETTEALLNLEHLSDGEDVIEATVKDPVGLSSATAKTTVKIDNTAPYNVAISGLPPYNEIGYGNYKVKVSATDGSGTTPSSGVASMTLSVDGKEIGTPHGSCTPGPCTATGEWTINGGEYAAGRHTISMTATDGAGNKASGESYLIFHAAEQEAVGPGSIEPASGAFTLSSTDVSIAAPDSPGLSVERSYQSRRLANAAEGPFGRQWQGLSFGGNQNLTILPTGSIVFTASSGAQSLFTKEGTKFVSPTGDTNLTLTEESSTKFKLVDQAGNTTIFTVPSGGSGTLLTPASRESVGHAGATKYTFQTVGGITEPTQALAPPPAGVSCTTLVRGCRALTFNYAATTTATGEAPSEWGDYTGHITRVYLTAYNPTAKEMQTTTVAQYSYDKQGRLRAEWDPRISPALKTTYGYDAEGHVTAVSPAGQQPWILNYGTIEGDSTAGRLLSVTRPAASTALGEGIAPTNTELPKLSNTSPVQGTEDTVSNGAWSHSPLSYAYQWQQCNASGAECQPIVGAVNQGYTPRYGDEGHTLRVLVLARNSGGTSPTVETAASAVVPYKTFPPTYSFSFGEAGTTNGKFSDPQYVAVGKYGAKEEVLVTDRYNNRVQVFDTAGKYKRQFGTAGTGETQFKEPIGIAADKENEGHVFVADSGNKRIKHYEGLGEGFVVFSGSTHVAGRLGGMTVGSSKGQEYVANAGANAIEEFETFPFTPVWKKSVGKEGTGESFEYKQPAAVTWGEGSYWVADTGNNRVMRGFTQFGSAGTGPGQFKGPKGVQFVTSVGLYAVDTGNDRVELFCTVTSGTSCTAGINKYATQFGEPPSPAINKTQETSYEACLAAEKSPIECASLYPSGVPKDGPGQMNLPTGIAVDAAGNLYVVDAGGSRVEKWTGAVKPASPPLSPVAPPNPGTSAVWTIEYKVPVSGAGAPHEMTSGELAKWGQTDQPVEATAIFPPDEPMGWPAKDYKRATVVYRDSKDRVVNGATPTGAISTTEYNANNDVTRTLTADNRLAALKEGAKSAEAAAKLDTQSTYNSEGTELLSTLGPIHTVKLASGVEKQARSHTVYSYDEGAPAEGGPYRLPTKVVKGAQIEGEAEQDIRTTLTSYSGQENLGWKLRKPTSVTTDPTGLKLTHTTVYDSATGNPVETRSPAGSGSGSAAPVYSSQFGELGSGNGQFNKPWNAAFDSGGNIWVTDRENHRIEEFSPSGVFSKAYGEFGTGEKAFSAPVGIAINKTAGDVYIVDEVNAKVEELTTSGTFVRSFGKKGSGTGEFSNPDGVALDASGNVWVADYTNNRIQEFSSTGTFIAAYGTAGTGNGQFKSPSAIAIYGETVYVTDTLNNRVQELSLTGAYKGQFGSLGTGNGQFKEPEAIAVDPGQGNIYVVDTANSRVQKFSSSGTFLATFGSVGWETAKMSWPRGIAVNSAGEAIVVDSGNNRAQKWIPANQGAHDTKFIYYTTASNGEYPSCGAHAEWANLVCEAKPAAQPGTPGLPELPFVTTTYNMLDEPEVTSQTVGTTTRTATATYDSAGRLTTSAVSSTVGTALPTVTYEYNAETGTQEKSHTTVEGKTQSLLAVFNRLGQITSYTDASGNVSTFEYEPERDARLKTVNDGKGTQTYSYDEITGLPTKLVDSAAGTFTGIYDVGGNQTSEGYPNGMSGNYTYNSVGEATSLEYVKTTHCTEKCTWYSDSIVPSIYGQAISQTSTLASDGYTYDNAGRLIQVQETPAGKGCTTRLYGYDEDTNRLSLTTREPGLEGKCAIEGGTSEVHSYDSADRLIDSGAKYDTFGNITALPAADAGGFELTSGFFTNNHLAGQTQNGETIGYQLDPARRVSEVISTGKVVASVVNHYTGGSEMPAWTSELSAQWTRNIPGLGSGLTAIQHNGETPVLQLTDLRGNIVATAAESETETKLLGTNRTTEYGVPTTEAPAKYSWLGSHELPTELPSGVVGMGARSYVPQIGRFLQVDPQSGGSANAYAYTYGDPVNSIDPTGEYTVGGPSQALINSTAEEAAEAVAEQAAINQAAREEAERKAAEEEEWWGEYLGGGEEEEEGEEEGEEEYAALHEGASEGQVEDGLVSGKVVQSQEGPGDAKANESGEDGHDGSVRNVGRRKHRRKYNACTGHPNPADHSEGCCVSGKALPKAEWNPVGKPCDVAGPAKCETAGCQPAHPTRKLDCPEGSSPGVAYFNGKPVCMPDGAEDPRL